jgi:hypothetical protein
MTIVGRAFGRTVRTAVESCGLADIDIGFADLRKDCGSGRFARIIAPSTALHVKERQ